MGLVEERVSWPEPPRSFKKKKKESDTKFNFIYLLFYFFDKYTKFNFIIKI